jgi:hypothetical protein
MRIDCYNWTRGLLQLVNNINAVENKSVFFFFHFYLFFIYLIINDLVYIFNVWHSICLCVCVHLICNNERS